VRFALLRASALVLAAAAAATAQAAPDASPDGQITGVGPISATLPLLNNGSLQTPLLNNGSLAIVAEFGNSGFGRGFVAITGLDSSGFGFGLAIFGDFGDGSADDALALGLAAFGGGVFTLPQTLGVNIPGVGATIVLGGAGIGGVEALFGGAGGIGGLNLTGAVTIGGGGFGDGGFLGAAMAGFPVNNAGQIPDSSGAPPAGVLLNAAYSSLFLPNQQQLGTGTSGGFGAAPP
jgi:hypothetical protein